MEGDSLWPVEGQGQPRLDPMLPRTELATVVSAVQLPHLLWWTIIRFTQGSSSGLPSTYQGNNSFEKMRPDGNTSFFTLIWNSGTSSHRLDVPGTDVHMFVGVGARPYLPLTEGLDSGKASSTKPKATSLRARAMGTS